MRYVAFVCMTMLAFGVVAAEEPVPQSAAPADSSLAGCSCTPCGEAERIRHILEAAAHLAAAGKHDDATRLRSEAEAARQRFLTAKLAQLAQLQAEVDLLCAADHELTEEGESADRRSGLDRAVRQAEGGDDNRGPLPRRDPNVNEYWDLTLKEALRTALANSKVLRNLGGQAEIRHPLLQGAGLAFNRIAGPNSNAGIFAGQTTNGPIQNPNSLPGTYNGVVLARINTDITLADFEAGVRNFCGDLERSYWDLYYNYRNLNAVQAGRDSALQTWRKVYALYVSGTKGGEAEKEAQAREQYFLFRAQVENSLGLLYTAESRLRYMMGLAPTDGRLIRPKDEPTTAEVKFDWSEILPEALKRNVELRKLKWVVKRNEQIVNASRNYLSSRLDPKVADSSDSIGGQCQEMRISGFKVTVPTGLRLAMAGVRNAELALAASRKLLQDQELELTHMIANSIRDLDRNYQVSVTTFNRRVAAARQVNAVEAALDVGTATFDMLLDAQRRSADAEIAYYRALVDYNMAIMQVHFRKNTLLEHNGIQLVEQPWPSGQSASALRNAVVRQTEGEDNDAELLILVRPSMVETAPDLPAEFRTDRARYDAPTAPSSRRKPHPPPRFLVPSYQTPIRP